MTTPMAATERPCWRAAAWSSIVTERKPEPKTCYEENSTKLRQLRVLASSSRKSMKFARGDNSDSSVPLRLSFGGVEFEREREPEVERDTGGADDISCWLAGADAGTGVRASDRDGECDCGMTTSSSSCRTWSRRLLTSCENGSESDDACDCEDV